MSKSLSDTQHLFSVILHFKLIYSLIATLLSFQIASFWFLYSYSPTDTLKCNTLNLNVSRGKRQVTDAFIENTHSAIDEWGKFNSSKVLEQDEDGKVLIRQETNIPMEVIGKLCRDDKHYCPPGLPGTSGAPDPIVEQRGDPEYSGDKGEIRTNGEADPIGYSEDESPHGLPGLQSAPGTPELHLELDVRKQIYDTETGQVTKYGSEPPKRVAPDFLCPPPDICLTCIRRTFNLSYPPSVHQNKQSYDSDLFSVLELLNYKELQIKHFDNYTGMGPRKFNCLVSAIEKPKYHQFINSTYGWWMKESSSPIAGISTDTFWVTNESFPNHLYEYSNKTMFRRQKYTRNYDLTLPFMGSSHVVFNGSFYYHQKDTSNIICYDLISHTTTNISVPYFDLGNNSRLYSEKHNFMDFSVDDNGLWVIYGLAHSNNTVILKLQEKTLNIEYGWNISVDHRRAGEMFIVCGVLYVVNSTVDRNARIRFALDLIKNEQVEVDIPFINPFKKTTMIGYNHKDKELFTWDKGNQLTYPIRILIKA